MYPMIVFLFYSLASTLECWSGTDVNHTTCVTTNGNECIRTEIWTPNLPGPGSIIYACGNCSSLNGVPSLKDTNCCNQSDLCQSLSLNVTTNSSLCDSNENSTSCLKRSDCYWCSNALGTGVGVCKSLKGFPSCYILPVFIHPSVCGPILCPPIRDTLKYRYIKLSKQFLVNFGLPPLSMFHPLPPSPSLTPFY